MESPEEVLLDVNSLAQGQSSIRSGVTRSARTTACWPTSRTPTAAASSPCGSRTWRPANSCRWSIKGLSTSIAWTDDSSGFFYIENDPETLLSTRVRLHTLGRRGQRPPGLRGTRPQLLHGRRQDHFGEVHLHQCPAAPCPLKRAARRPRSPALRDPGAARARLRVRRRPSRRALGDPHQLGSPELPVDAGQRERHPRAQPVAGSDRARRFRLHRGLRTVRRLHRCRRALAGSDPPAPAQERRQRAVRGKADETAYSMGLSVNAEPTPIGCATPTPR
jgi:hypothetical protein